MQDLMPPVNTPDKLFHDGDPTQGVEGTIVTADWMNNSQGATRDAQQEIINVLGAAEIETDPSKQNQLVTAIQSLISVAINAAKYVPDVGELYITKIKTDPSAKWPGTTWEYLGDGLSLRTAKADFSDIGATVGTDSVTLSVANLPSHTHGIGGTTGNSSDIPATTSTFDYGTKGTSTFDYGTKQTDVQGDHAHNYTFLAWEAGWGWPSGNTNMGTVTQKTSTGGAHAHNVGIGAHSHTVGIGAHNHTVTIPAHSHTLPSATGAVGSGAAISTISRSMNVAVWVRTS